jgi:hypothetical protein
MAGDAGITVEAIKKLIEYRAALILAWRHVPPPTRRRGPDRRARR